MVHKDMTHDPRASGEEVGAIHPSGALGIDQVQVRFVDERRGLERLARRLSRHVMFGDAV
jgi:hypothetical protein